VGSRAWDPDWARELPLVIEAPVPGGAERDALWRRALNGARSADGEAATATAQFRLTPEQVGRAAQAALRAAAARGDELSTDDLRTAARAQNAVGLERLARRIRPQADWDDLVLPEDVHLQLRELIARLRHRELVIDAWGAGGASARGRGVTCLFAGESGTGKTLSAEVLAGHLGLDLYVIDLSSVVDKYVGETEKNLDRVFAEAEGVNGVLLFDEADALFGKRSEVKDARDRWANMEVAYLLQRMELFDGIAILTTNLRANLDESFTRRLAAVVDFPRPDEDQRRLLWERNLGDGMPRADDLDLGFLAASFELSGGSIRNIVLAAAYMAADDGHTVGMPHLIRAIQREYRKLGRLCAEGEFGPYHALISPSSA
jgi:SpoVK/Ycf46/Vps4 family AAA+-type ATPase